MTDDRVRAFLADTLVLWGVSGTVETGEAPAVAVIRAADGTIVSVERYSVHPSTSPRYAQDERGRPASFRWLVRSDRARPCASIVGLLNAVRSALGVERGSAVRVVPPPVRPEPFDNAQDRLRGSEVEG